MNQYEKAGVKTRRMASTGDELSLLGFGCMRFPKKGGRIDMEAVERLVTHAIDCGVNYFDTAYVYGGSEDALGTVLAKTGADGRKLRDRVKIATKLAFMMIKTRPDMDKMLAASLERLQTNYVDYYLVHSLTSFADWEKMKGLGICDFIDKQRAAGKIRHIGFSWHGNLGDFRRLVDDYSWEFCQIQYNYLDENFQAGTEGLAYAAQKGLGVIIMEPLRGGTLVDKMPPAARQIIDGYKGENGTAKSAAYWGLRWVMDKPEVGVVLSGMSTMDQLVENIGVASEAQAGSLSASDAAMIDRVKEVYRAYTKIPCTGCAYCMPCPHGVDIPGSFSALNSKAMFGGMRDTVQYLWRTGGKKPSRASQCQKCGACEKKCPQHLEIMNGLSEAVKALEKPWLTIPADIVLKVMGR